MKKYPNILMILIICALFATMESCRQFDDFLEKPVTSDVTIDDIFESPQHASNAMTACYINLPFGLPVQGPNKPYGAIGQGHLDHLTDLMVNLHGTQNGPYHFYYPGNYNSSVEQNNPSYVKYSFTDEGQWTSIRRCWTILEKIDDVIGMDDAEKRQFKAEARTIIAIHYTEMLRHLGGVPKVDHLYLPNEDMNTRRMTIREMLEWIDELIEQSWRDLPWEYGDPNMYGRLTRAGALAVRVRALHFAASPLFNDDHPYLGTASDDALCWWLGEKDPELWKQARDAADFLITEAEANGYGLVLPATQNKAAYQAAYRSAYFSPNNGETLIVTRAPNANNTNVRGIVNNTTAAGSFGVFINDGGYSVTQNWVDMFPMANGYDIKPDQPNYAAGWDEQKPVDNRDPRLYESVAVNNDPWGTGGLFASFWQGGREGTAGTGGGLAKYGTSCRKFTLGGNGAQMEFSGKPLVYPYIRLADIYLIYAEAANQYEGSPSTLALARANAVRGRVGVPGLPAGMDKDKFHAAVMKERCCEFGMECSRWFDIVRWKMEEPFKAKLRAQRSFLWAKDPAFNMSGRTQGVRANSYEGDYLIGDGVIGDNGVLYRRLWGGEANVSFNAANHVITYQYFDGYETDVRAWATNFSPRWYLSAFPMSEVNKNYGLIQNPGW